ncbi:hypothetical protein WR25_10496 [Diploscapter pachys]|uniref:C2H2-type domain-containing protein n=1 Tax=Diploscapter pachys TaxID=2018661 RepID=A0A2A2JYQ1_9BILA|nr:hypothetical protein WR25_10496 [Diploscapter pachys]
MNWKRYSPGDVTMDDVSDSDAQGVSSSGVSPIDLSTSRREKLILEDKSNLIQSLAAIASPQLLSLCAQLAAQQKDGKMMDEVMMGQIPFPFLPQMTSSGLSSEIPTMTTTISNNAVDPRCSAPTTSASSTNGNKEDRFACPSQECDQVFPTQATRLWHIFVSHEGEDLIYCNTCGAIYKDWDELHSHNCPRQQAIITDSEETITASLPQRCASADQIGGTNGSQNTPMEVGGSAPCSPATFGIKSEDQNNGAEEMMEIASGDRPNPFKIGQNGSEAPTPFNLFGSLFPMKQPSSMNPMELSVGSPIHPFFPLSMPPFGNHHPGGGPPLPFMLRSPFDQRPEFYPPNRQDNEDDWEALMEISTSNEAEKIRALVGDKALPTTDPNQCILCRRVLSCKSALQMHYRTHTGKLPK